MRKNKLPLLLVTLFISVTSFAQKGEYPIEQNSGWKDRIYFGGGMGLSGGSWGTSISLSPMVGYMVTSRVSLGVGATYQFYKYNSGIYDYSDHRYGGMLFGRVNLFRQIFAYGEYSFLNYSYNGNEDDRRTVSRLPLGLGLSQPLGRRGALNMIAAYDVLYLNSGPYASPWVFSVFFSI